VSRKQIVILGGGTGGTMTANRLRKRFDPDEADIHVVDRDNKHIYQPGLLFVPFGLAQLDELTRPRARQLRSGITFHENGIEEAWIERDEVLLDDGTVLPYDVLVVASGARLQPEETAGLTAAQHAKLPRRGYRRRQYRTVWGSPSPGRKFERRSARPSATRNIQRRRLP